MKTVYSTLNFGRWISAFWSNMSRLHVQGRSHFYPENDGSMFPLFTLTLVGVPSGKTFLTDIGVTEWVLKGASKVSGRECLKAI
jgi:hypothetical protein